MIEIIIACAIIGIVVFSFIEAGILSSRLSRTASDRTEAAFLLQEGIEVMKLFRDRGWSTNIAPLVLDTPYFLSFNGSDYDLVTSPPPFIDGVFERTVTLSAVNRDASKDIATAGSDDPSTKKVTVAVSWHEQTGTSTEATDFYIINLFQN